MTERKTNNRTKTTTKNVTFEQTKIMKKYKRKTKTM